ncbi:hypothetical protein FE224_08315 [Serratia marcescens]|nr:hypothetical protein [Serratia ureilytica]NVC31879.1 hypothetical protein [Serratia marcescens]NVC45909.1 hypothetical protein [Serratia marcescens]QDI15186.1 hypothetical protein FBF84_19350 [Serratia marcescens]QDI24927.1 hypothetical protein FBF90_19340 [Serratia marcescens]
MRLFCFIITSSVFSPQSHVNLAKEDREMEILSQKDMLLVAGGQQSDEDRDLEEMRELLSSVGSTVGGGVGAYVGGVIGGPGGALIGSGVGDYIGGKIGENYHEPDNVSMTPAGIGTDNHW